MAFIYINNQHKTIYMTIYIKNTTTKDINYKKYTRNYKIKALYI